MTLCYVDILGHFQIHAPTERLYDYWDMFWLHPHTSDGDIETCSHAFLSCCDDFIEKLCLRNVLNGIENSILGRPKETFSLFAPS